MHSLIPYWRAVARPGMSLDAARRAARADRLEAVLRPEAAARWRSTRVSMVTPQYVEMVLTAALSGDILRQWELFDLMEDTWPRLSKCLQELRRAVVAMHWPVMPWVEEGSEVTEDAAERARLVSHALWTMRPDHDELDFRGVMSMLLDAWAKGISIVELQWEAREGPGGTEILAPRAGRWVHPAEYTMQQGRLYLMREDGTLEDPDPDRYIIAIAQARAQWWPAAALLRPLAWWWAAANFAADWLLNYAQLFGVPLRWATYARGADEQVIAQIGDMLANMGAAGWAAFPEGTQLQLLEGQKTAGTSPQEAILERADRYCDLLLLGQTLTTDAGDRGTQALGTVHERVRGDILSAAADWLAGTLQQLVRSIVRLNYGDEEMLPELRPEPVRVTDKAAETDRILRVVQGGIPVPRAWAYEQMGIPMPGPDDEVIEPPSPVPFGLPAARAVEARRIEADPDEYARRKAALLARYYQQAMRPFIEIVSRSRDPRQCLRELEAYYPSWSPQRLAEAIDEALEIISAHAAQ